MRLIVEEEKEQLATLQQQIVESGSKLKPFKDHIEFGKLNDIQQERGWQNTKKSQKHQTKQVQTEPRWLGQRRYLWPTVTISGHRGRSHQQRHSSQAGTDTSAQSPGSEDETSSTMYFLDKDSLELEDRPPSEAY